MRYYQRSTKTAGESKESCNAPLLQTIYTIDNNIDAAQKGQLYTIDSNMDKTQDSLFLSSALT